MFDRIVNGTLLPGIILGVLEIPFLVVYFSGVVPSQIFPYIVPVPNASAVALLLMFVFSALIIGFFVKEPGRSIKIFALMQAIGFSLSIVALLVYPNTAQKSVTLGISQSYDYYYSQIYSSFLEYIAGWAITMFLLGSVITGLSSMLAERLAEPST